MTKEKLSSKEIGIEKNPALWQNIISLFCLRLRDGEVILQRWRYPLFFTVWIYFFACFLCFAEFVARGICVEMLPIAAYCFWYPWCQQLVFTNQRVIACGGLWMLRKKSFLQPNIKLFYNPLQRLLWKNVYILKVSEDTEKAYIPTISVSDEQFESARQKYQVERKPYWFQIGW